MTKNDKLRKLLESVFDELREGVRESVPSADYDRMRFDFAFHMTDWSGDLEKFAELCEHPDSWSRDDATKFIVGFMYHVVPHLNAAHELLLSDSEAKVTP